MTTNSARATHILLAVLVVLVDRCTKRLVAARIAMYTHIQIIPGFFRLTHTENTGAAFSLLAARLSRALPKIIRGSNGALFQSVLIRANPRRRGSLRRPVKLFVDVGVA